jgi:hypothetical protein
MEYGVHICPAEVQQLIIFTLLQYCELFHDEEYEGDVMSNWFNVETRDYSRGVQLGIESDLTHYWVTKAG